MLSHADGYYEGYLCYSCKQYMLITADKFTQAIYLLYIIYSGNNFLKYYNCTWSTAMINNLRHAKDF